MATNTAPAIVSEKDYSISYLRVAAMVMIMLCHLTSQSGNSLIAMSSQFFNVGVTIFFMISGYLYGRKGISVSSGAWYRRRFLKLAPPYYLFLLLLLTIYLMRGIAVVPGRWLIQLLCLQGCEIYVWGAEHLWFLTVLLACYLVTPLFNKLRGYLKKELSVLLAGFILQIVVTLFFSEQMGKYLFDVEVYLIAFILGEQNIVCTNRAGVLFSGILIVVGAALRLIGRSMLDGTIAYNIYVATLTHLSIAIGIIGLFQYLFRTEPNKAVSFLEKISFEVYLVHYMFITGPVSLMSTTPFFTINCILAALVSLLTAYCLHQAVYYLRRLLHLN